jgi:site-specific DNA-methyltransferase (adenine-specific)
MANERKNTLYYGDNLDVLRRHVGDETVDLVYLDPPFNSIATYNVLFADHNGSRAAACLGNIRSFFAGRLRELNRVDR